MYCPFCGKDVSGEIETDIGVICPQCHNDFWASEALNSLENMILINDVTELLTNKEEVCLKRKAV